MTFWEKLSKIEDYIYKYWYYVASPLLMGFLVIYMGNAQDDKKELEENLETTVGKVYRYRGVPKKSKRIYYYEFYLDGKKYKGSSSGYMSKDTRVGNYYQVEYSGINPNNNRMNFDIEFTVNFLENSAEKIKDINFVRL